MQLTGAGWPGRLSPSRRALRAHRWRAGVRRLSAQVTDTSPVPLLTADRRSRELGPCRWRHRTC